MRIMLYMLIISVVFVYYKLLIYNDLRFHYCLQSRNNCLKTRKSLIRNHLREIAARPESPVEAFLKCPLMIIPAQFCGRSKGKQAGDET